MIDAHAWIDFKRPSNGADFHGYCDLTNEITRLALMPAVELDSDHYVRVGVGCGLDSTPVIAGC